MTGPVPDWLAHRAAAMPGKVAVRVDGLSVTYAELEMRVARLASALVAGGISTGDRVALLAQNSLEYVEAAHAVPRAGAILVPLNTRLAPDELAWQLADSEARAVLCHAPTREQARGVARNAGIPALPLPLTRDVPPAELRDTHEPGETHSIIYTSGTTGRPKGAQLTFGNFWASAAASAFNVGVDLDDCWLACMPLFHVGGLSIVLRSAIYGTSALIHASFDETAVNRALREEGVTLLSVVPTMLQRMLDADDDPYPPTVRAVLVGGGPVPEPLLARAVDRGLRVVQTYGLTEAASQVATLVPTEALLHTGSAGKPLLTTQVRIDAARGEPGEILVAGPTVTPGYWKNEPATAEAIRNGWLHTGDIGRFDEDGYLYVLDRRDDLIVSGGENVYPAEVETVLLGYPGVRAVAVVGVADAAWGQTVAAAIVAGSEIEPADVERFARERLAAYKVPRVVRQVEELPVTANGKVRRGVVRAWLEAPGDALAD